MPMRARPTRTGRTMESSHAGEATPGPPAAPPNEGWGLGAGAGLGLPGLALPRRRRAQKPSEILPPFLSWSSADSCAPSPRSEAERDLAALLELVQRRLLRALDAAGGRRVAAGDGVDFLDFLAPGVVLGLLLAADLHDLLAQLHRLVVHVVGLGLARDELVVLLVGLRHEDARLLDGGDELLVVLLRLLHELRDELVLLVGLGEEGVDGLVGLAEVDLDGGLLLQLGLLDLELLPQLGDLLDEDALLGDGEAGGLLQLDLGLQVVAQLAHLEGEAVVDGAGLALLLGDEGLGLVLVGVADRKSTRLNSSH